jgi:uncharacterized FlgJ-related protein
MKKKFLTSTLTLIFSIFSFSAEVPKNNERITKQNLWETIKSLNIQHPEIVFAQALLETGEFTSKLFKTHNNLFGMKIPKQRETLAINYKSNKGYAKFNHWTISVEDYALFQNYIFKKKKLEQAEYFKYLDKRYAEDKKYVIKLKKIINQNKYIFNS